MSDKHPSAAFDARAAGWDANAGRVTMASNVVAAIRRAVPLRPDMRVLDVGAGTGLVSLGLLPDVAEVTASDFSSGMVSVLEEKARAAGVRNLRTRVCDARTADWPSARFDLIVSSMALHHLPDIPAVLRHLYPALAPGGWVALADLDSEGGHFHADKTGVFHNGFDRAVFCRWLAEAGFAEAETRDAHRLTRPDAEGVERTFTLFLATARKA